MACTVASTSFEVEPSSCAHQTQLELCTGISCVLHSHPANLTATKYPSCRHHGRLCHSRPGHRLCAEQFLLWLLEPVHVSFTAPTIHFVPPLNCFQVVELLYPGWPRVSKASSYSRWPHELSPAAHLSGLQQSAHCGLSGCDAVMVSLLQGLPGACDSDGALVRSPAAASVTGTPHHKESASCRPHSVPVAARACPCSAYLMLSS